MSDSLFLSALEAQEPDLSIQYPSVEPIAETGPRQKPELEGQPVAPSAPKESSLFLDALAGHEATRGQWAGVSGDEAVAFGQGLKAEFTDAGNLPFVGTGVQGKRIYDMVQLGEALEANPNDPELQRRAMEYLVEQTKAGARGESSGYLTGSIIGQSAPMMVEFAATAGAGPALRKGLTVALKSKADDIGRDFLEKTITERVGKKVAEKTFDVTAQLGAMEAAGQVAGAMQPGEYDPRFGGRITAATWDEVAKGTQFWAEVDPDGTLQAEVYANSATFAEKLDEGTLSALITVGAEQGLGPISQLGGKLARLGPLDRVRALYAGTVASVARTFRISPQAAGAMLRQASFHGPAGEYLEERDEELIRQLIPSLADPEKGEWNLSWLVSERWAEELLAFAGMGAAGGAAAGAAGTALDRIRRPDKLDGSQPSVQEQLEGTPEDSPQEDPGKTPPADAPAAPVEGEAAAPEATEPPAPESGDLRQADDEALKSFVETGVASPEQAVEEGPEGGMESLPKARAEEAEAAFEAEAARVGKEYVETPEEAQGFVAFMRDTMGMDVRFIEDPPYRGHLVADGAVVMDSAIIEEGPARLVMTGIHEAVHQMGTRARGRLEAAHRAIRQLDPQGLLRATREHMAKRIEVPQNLLAEEGLAEYAEKGAVLMAYLETAEGQQTLETLRAKDRTSFQKVVDWLKELISKVTPLKLRTPAQEALETFQRKVDGSISGAQTVEAYDSLRLALKLTNQGAMVTGVQYEALAPSRAHTVVRPDSAPDSTDSAPDAPEGPVDEGGSPADSTDAPADSTDSAPEKVERKLTPKERHQRRIENYRRGGPDVPFITFLRANGGLKNDAGDFDAYTNKEGGSHVRKGAFGVGPLIREGGMSFDEALRLAHEAGYITRGYQETDKSDLLDLLDRNPLPIGSETSEEQDDVERQEAEWDEMARAAGFENADDALRHFGLEDRYAPRLFSAAALMAEQERQLDMMQAFRDASAGQETLFATPQGLVDDMKEDAPRLLGNVLAKEYEDRGRVTLAGKQIRSAEDFARIAQVFRHPAFETFRWVFTDANGEVVYQENVTSRMPGVTPITQSPPAGYKYRKDWQDDALYSAFSSAEKAGAKSFWVMHNHPSGSPEPSDADKDVTRSLSDLRYGMEFRGHLVINSGEYAFMDPVRKTAGGRSTEAPWRLAKIDNLPPGPAQLEHPLLRRLVRSYTDLLSLAMEFKERDRWFNLIGLAGGGAGVSAVAEVPLSLLERAPLRLAGEVLSFMRKTGSVQAVAVGLNSGNLTKETAGLLAESIKSGILTDAVTVAGGSLGRELRNRGWFPQTQYPPIQHGRKWGVRGHRFLPSEPYPEGQRFSPKADQLGFYSGALAALEADPQKSYKPAQIRPRLLKYGAKEDELALMGLDEWVSGLPKGERVPSEAVEAFIRDNEVVVEETTYIQEVGPDPVEEYRERVEAMSFEEAQAEWESVFGTELDEQDWLDYGVDELVQEFNLHYDPSERVGDGPQYDDESLRLPNPDDPTGDTYGELLLRLPLKREKYEAGRHWVEVRQSSGVSGQFYRVDRYGEWDLIPYSTREEAEAALGEPRMLTRDAEGTYRSPHWSEANVLAHVRFTERQGPSGERVLFLEEVQSDWHQEGAKRGYVGQGPGPAPLDWKTEGAEEGDAAWAELPSGIGITVTGLEDGRWGLFVEGRMTGPFDTIEAAKEYADTHMGPDGYVGGDKSLVPDGPFKQSWPKLALKRMIRWAAENGYDGIAWTTGAQQANRYESRYRSEVEELSWEPTTYGEAGSKDLDIDTRFGSLNFEVLASGKVKAMLSEFDGRHLEDILGKEMSDRVLGEDSGSEAGSGLVIGGRGFVAFYDKRLVATANKLGRRFGSKVSWIELDFGSESSKAPYLETGPEMRKAVVESGFERFSPADVWHGGPHDFDKFTTKAIGTGEGAQVYGWGLYFASRKGVAEWYKEKLSRNRGGVDVKVMADLEDEFHEKAVKASRDVYADFRIPGREDADPDLDPNDWGDVALDWARGIRARHMAEFRDKIDAKDTLDEWYQRLRELRHNEDVRKGVHGRLSEAERTATEDYILFIRDQLELARTKLVILRTLQRSLRANLLDLKFGRGGFGYRAELAPEEDQYLLWDVGFDSQSEKVKDALRKYNPGKFDAGPTAYDDAFQQELARWRATRVEYTGDRMNRWAAQKASQGFDLGPDEANAIMVYKDHYYLLKDGGEWVFPLGTGYFRYPTLEEAEGALIEEFGDLPSRDFGQTGSGIYKSEADNLGSKRAASEALLQAGIRGIKYLDGTSRSRGRGSYNYVIFDEDDVTITGRFSPRKKNLAPLKQAEGMVPSQPKQTPKEWLYEGLVDALHHPRKMVREAGQEGSRLDFDRDQRLLRGKAAYESEELLARYWEPVKETIEKWGITLADAGRHLIARHAGERNEQMRRIGSPGHSGMTDQEAEGILEANYRGDNRQAYLKLERLFRKMHNESLDVMLDAELINEETYGKLKGTYTWYMPLFTSEQDESTIFDDIFMGSISDGGPRMMGKELERALGRTKPTDPEAVMAFALIQAQRVRARAHLNRARRSLLEFVKAFPQESMYAVDPVQTHLEINPKTGMVREAKDYYAPPVDNVVEVKVDGQTVNIHFSEKRPEVALALNRLNVAELNAFVSGAAVISRAWSRMATQLSPEFVAKNTARDVPFGYISMLVEHGPKEAKEFAGEFKDPDFWGALNRHFRKEDRGGTTKHDQYLREWREDGGPINLASLTDARVEQDRMAEELGESKRPNIKGYNLSSLKAVFEPIGRFNTMMENATRFAAYVTMRRKTGDSPNARANSALYSKEITTNFEQGGRGGAWMNAFIPFSRASLTGLDRGWKVIKGTNAPKYLAGMIGASAALAAANIAAAPDDDDGDNYFASLPEYVKRTSVIFQIPFHESAVTLPAPFVFRFFNYMGTKVAEVGMGKADATDALWDVLVALADEVNPLGSTDVAEVATPGVLRPLIHIARNKNFMGSPIMPHKWDDSVPDSETYFPGASGYAVTLAAWLNRMGGGSKYRAGTVEALDVSPETIDYATKSATAGAGAFLLRSWELRRKLLDGEPIAAKDIPIARGFYRQEDKYKSTRLFREFGLDLSEERRRRKDGEGQMPGGTFTSLERMYKQTKKRTDSLRGLARNARDEGRLMDAVKFEEEQRLLYARFNRRAKELGAR